MPNGRVHRNLGGFAGAGAVLATEGEQPTEQLLAKVAVGWLAGRFGGSIPDILEPAIHPWHRDVFHSVAAGGTILTLASKFETSLRETAHTEATALRQVRLALRSDDPKRVILWTAEMAWLLLPALVIGFVAGYLSHLVADGMTPRGINLISRKTV